MDIFEDLKKQPSTIRTVEMHTSGEPTRIVISGFPILQGKTLLEKRRYAGETHEIDNIRKWLMREPRGHEGMYGAILVQETELTLSDQADIGVLFCHNDGYSTMCGHATIALGRFLVDSRDTEVFPRRQFLQIQTHDQETFTVLRVHAPCGVVTVYVPTTFDGKSDIAKPVRFRSVRSFVSSPEHGITLDVPTEMAWPKLTERIAHNKAPLKISLDIAYGGAFYALVSATELGFTTGLRGSDFDYKELAEAARIIRILLNKDSMARQSFTHPDEPDMGFLYGVTVVDSNMHSIGLTQYQKSEAGLCFFADEQIDRSPTGSCVSARVALAIDRFRLSMWEWCSYESFLSVQFPGNAFRGRAVERTEKGYIIEIEGFAYYTGAAAFAPPLKGIDEMGEGFELRLPM